MDWLSLLGMITVEPVHFLFMTTVFLQMPVTQQLIMRKVCLADYNESICDSIDDYDDIEDEIQTKSSHWIFYNVLAVTLPCVVFSLFVSSWSDMAGRKKAIVTPVIGALLSSTNLAINAWAMDLHLGYLLISNFIFGLSGGMATMIVGVNSYISDITTPQNRTKRVSIVQSMIFLGGIFGTLIGGLLLNSSGFASVYLLALALQTVLLLYCTFYLKESYHPQGDVAPQKRHFCRSLFNWKNVHRALTVNFVPREGNKRKHLLLLVSVVFIGSICISGDADITVLYVKKSPFKWSPTMIGIFLALRNTCSGMALFVGMPTYFAVTSEKNRAHDATLAIFALVFGVSSFIIVAVANADWILFLAAIIGAPTSLVLAVLPSMRSKLVEPKDYGAMFAFTASLEQLCQLGGSIIFNNLYPVTLSFMPGFSYLVMAAMLLLGIGVFIVIGIDQKKEIVYDKLSPNGYEETVRLRQEEADEEDILMDNS